MIKVTRKRRSGRPKKLSEQQIDFVISQYNNGLTQKEIATRFEVSISTIRRAIEERR